MTNISQTESCPEWLKIELERIKKELNLQSSIEKFEERVRKRLNDQNLSTVNQTLLEESSQSLLAERDGYIQVLKHSLQRRNEPPFYWNQNPSASEDARCERDNAQYMEFIDYCEILDDIYILDELGICPLFDQKSGISLARPFGYYQIVFEEKFQEPNPPCQNRLPYYQYLSQVFKCLETKFK